MTPHQKTVGVVMGAALAVAGVASVVVAAQPCDSDAGLVEGAGCVIGSAELFGLGLALGVIGLGTIVGTAAAPTIESPPRAAISEPTTTADREPVPASVSQLAAQASIAAHAGRCVDAAAIAHRIEMIDPDYRYGAFIKDAANASWDD